MHQVCQKWREGAKAQGRRVGRRSRSGWNSSRQKAMRARWENITTHRRLIATLGDGLIVLVTER
jgi:predicted NAD-dependent protein-ADP-ribosyltransferase YbiA (DUF1768 family)